MRTSIRPKARPSAPMTSIRPKARPARSGEMMPEEEMLSTRALTVRKPINPRMRGVAYADGGMVRGCKGVQSSGKDFKGTY
jgi:hypothetical protein